MEQNVEKHKYKDWDRHAHIIFLLQKKKATISELSAVIDESISRVSDCIWGKPSTL
jgi:hypothetical protein